MRRLKPEDQFPNLFAPASAKPVKAERPADLRLLQWCMRKAAQRAARRSAVR